MAANIPAASPPKFQKILAVKLADFGDALLVEPALRILHNAYPAAQIDVLTTQSGLPALARLPYLRQIILFDKYRFDNPRSALSLANLKAVWGFGWQLFRARYDTVIFFHHLTTKWGSLKYAALAVTTLAPLRVGLYNKLDRAWFLNHTIKDGGFGDQGRSELDYWLQLVQSLGASLPDETARRPLFTLSQAEHSFAQTQLTQIKAGQNSGPVVALYPGSGKYSLTRRWLPHNFALVGDALAQKFGAKIVVVGSPDEFGLAQQIQSLMQHPITILSGQTTLPQVGAVLTNCDLFIGNDGGLLHLAAAMNTPTLALFGPTNPVAWGWDAPDRMQILQADVTLSCRPCLYRGHELGHRYGCAPRPCLTALTASQIITAATPFLLKYL